MKDESVHLSDLVAVTVCTGVFEIVVDPQREISCAEESNYYVFGISVTVNVESVLVHDFPPGCRSYRNSAGSRSLK